MKSTFVILFILFSQSLWAKKLALTIPSSDGNKVDNREVYIEYGEPQNDLPMLLLGPGVNRGMLSFDNFLGAIKKRGFGYVALHFSTLPHSLDSLGAKRTPYFMKNDFGIEDYAFEFEAVGEWMRRKWKRQVVPVTLSFSGAPSSKLRSFPLVIDIAPMTSLDHARPQLGTYLNTLRLANMFNPFGPAIIRAAMDQTYATVWGPKTEEMIEGFGFDFELEEEIYEGYMTSSRALEDFEWDVTLMPKGGRRVFILGEEEAEELLKGQVETIEETIEKGQGARCFYVRGAPHAVSFAKPRTTAKIIEYVIRAQETEKPGCYDVRSINNFDFIPQSEFRNLF